MKLNYSFSKREIALILVLVLVLIGLLYYRFVYLRIGDQEKQYDTTDLEAQVQLEQLQLIEWEKMQNEIVAPKDGTVAQVVVKTGDKVDTGAALVVLA